MTEQEWIDADTDDPFRSCENCDLKYHEDYGSVCGA